MQIQISIYGSQSAIQLSIFLHFNESISGWRARRQKQEAEKSEQ